MNGDPVPYDEATLNLISKKNFEILLAEPEMTVGKLVRHHRLASYKTNLDIVLDWRGPRRISRHVIRTTEQSFPPTLSALSTNHRR
jgi:hypothetical protein